jgi:hypothetical protein
MRFDFDELDWSAIPSYELYDSFKQMFVLVALHAHRVPYVPGNLVQTAGTVRSDDIA